MADDYDALLERQKELMQGRHFSDLHQYRQDPQDPIFMLELRRIAHVYGATDVDRHMLFLNFGLILEAAGLRHESMVRLVGEGMGK